MGAEAIVPAIFGGVLLLFGLTRAFQIIWRPDSVRGQYACIVVERHRCNQRVPAEKGFIVQCLEVAFAYTNLFSISRWVGALARGRDYWDAGGCRTRWRSRDIREVRSIDGYVLLVLGFMILAYVLVRWAGTNGWKDWILLTLLFYFLAEMIHRNINVVLFDQLRGHPPPADLSRSVVLGLVNYAQVIIGFAILAQFFIVNHGDFQNPHCNFQDSLWASTKAATLIDFPNCNIGWVRTLFAAEVFVALFVLVILIAWGIANLPRRAAEK